MKLLQVALMCGMIGSIVGLQCYFCNDGFGDTSSACRDPFNTSTTSGAAVQLQDCGTGSYACSKSYLSSSSLTFTVRGCVETSVCPSADGCAASEYQGNSATGCCCTKNLCNGAGSVSVHLLTTAVLGLTAVAFTLY